MLRILVAASLLRAVIPAQAQVSARVDSAAKYRDAGGGGSLWKPWATRCKAPRLNSAAYSRGGS